MKSNNNPSAAGATPQQFEQMALYRKLKAKTTQHSTVASAQKKPQNFTSPGFLSLNLQKESLKLSATMLKLKENIN